MCSIFLNKMRYQRRNILFSLPQRRELNGNHMETIIEVLTKTAFLYQFLKVFFGCTDDTNIDRNRLLAADTFKFPFLKHSQQLDLHFQWNIIHVIEKYRASVGKFKTSTPRFYRSRK